MSAVVKAIRKRLIKSLKVLCLMCAHVQIKEMGWGVQLQSSKGILEEVEKMHSKYSCSRLHLQKEQRS